jgi:hypothetical protein
MGVAVREVQGEITGAGHVICPLGRVCGTQSVGEITGQDISFAQWAGFLVSKV